MKKRFTIIEWLIALGIISMFGVPSWAIEFTRTKNTATNVTCPIINATSNNTFATGANNTAFYVSTQDGEAAFSAFGASGANISIIGTSGVYNFPLNQTEMNHERVFVYYNGTGCLQQGFVINTVARGLLTAINDTVNSATVGNSVIKDLASGANATVNHATYGNSALNTLLGKIDANATAVNATVNHATYGNNALNTAIATRGVSNLTTSDNIGINWGDVSNPTTTLGLTGTTISSSQNITNVVGTANLNATLSY